MKSDIDYNRFDEHKDENFSSMKVCRCKRTRGE